MKNTTDEIITLISPDETFRGLSYGEWIIPYMNWLVSDSPDIYTNDNILYLRGSVRGQIYRSSNDRPIGSRSFLLEDDSVILDKTSEYGYTITTDTAVMFSPLFSFYSSNLRYRGKVIDSDHEIHSACISEMNNSSVMFANLYDLGSGRPMPLFANGEDTTSFLVESPIFTLSIPEDSLFADQFDVALERGKEYNKMMVYGSFIILRFNKPGKYQLDFGGIGENSYGTRSIYDIKVIESINRPIKDISSDMQPHGPRIPKKPDKVGEPPKPDI